MKVPIRKISASLNDMVHLDVLRIVASVSIMIYHFRGQLVVSGTLKTVVDHLGGLEIAVDLFFFISGFVIIRFYNGIRTATEYRQFLWKRIARLYPLHFVTMMGFVAIALAIMFLGLTVRTPEQFDLRCLWNNALLLQSLNLCPTLTFNPVSWSISAEMLIYCCLPVVLYLRRWKYAPLLLGLVWWAFVATRWPQGSTKPWSGLSYDYGFVRAVPSFLLGVASHDFRHRIIGLPGGEALMWSILALILAFMLLGVNETWLVFLAFAAVLSAIAADARASPSRLARVLAPLATLTYSLYLIHPIVDLIFISVIAKKLMHANDAVMIWVVVAALPITFVLAYLSYTLFENPARRRLTRWYAGRTSPTMSVADQHTPL